MSKPYSKPKGQKIEQVWNFKLLPFFVNGQRFLIKRRPLKCISTIGAKVLVFVLNHVIVQLLKYFSLTLQQDWLIQKKSNPEECKFTLNMVAEQLADCQRRAQEIKGYQKQFKMEVTRFEMLDEVINDVKLRQLLWDSLDLWKKTYHEYMYGDFNTLVPEDVNMFVAKLLKNIAQLDKGLPKNDITWDFKEEVEKFRERIPVITHLRNPTLKARHWLKIEAVLNHKFVPGEIITLEQLEELGAFNAMNELQEISAQASSEAALEALLKKVEDNWKELEFIVLGYRDSKDVFILGGLEEIQQVLDDSFINVNTILSSRNVGPIKPRVEEWLRLLDLFSKTIVSSKFINFFLSFLWGSVLRDHSNIT